MFQPCIHEGTALKACENYAETPKWVTGFWYFGDHGGLFPYLLPFPHLVVSVEGCWNLLCPLGNRTLVPESLGAGRTISALLQLLGKMLLK